NRSGKQTEPRPIRTRLRNGTDTLLHTGGRRKPNPVKAGQATSQETDKGNADTARRSRNRSYTIFPVKGAGKRRAPAGERDMPLGQSGALQPTSPRTSMPGRYPPAARRRANSITLDGGRPFSSSFFIKSM